MSNEAGKGRVEGTVERVAVPIAWYRNFHDIPRLFCVAGPTGVLLFEDSFDDIADDYTGRFTVKYVEAVEPSDAETILLRSCDLEPLATIELGREMFDDSRRASVIVPAHVVAGWHDLE